MHNISTTTPKIRAEIQAAPASASELAAPIPTMASRASYPLSADPFVPVLPSNSPLISLALAERGIH